MRRDSVFSTTMPSFVRLVSVLRSGPRGQRLQAWLGLGLLLAAGIWMFINLWRFLLYVALFLALVLGGLYLVGRSLRESPPSS